MSNTARIVPFVCVLLVGLSASRAATPFNVAAGKPVTLVGAFGSAPALAASVTDSVFLPKNTEWTTGTVWWDGNSYPGNYVEIDLLGHFLITGLIAQADDNDAYLLWYRDSGGVWKPGLEIPNYDFEPFGMQTRPNPYNDNEQFILPSPAVATAFRIYGNLNDGDRLFSVSEFQAFGLLIPEPGGGALLVIGLIAWSQRCRRTRRYQAPCT